MDDATATDVGRRGTHASFFSGVGGLDLGLERAGWHTVSLSEIDAYASAVLDERFPGVPNLGDIVALAERESGDEQGGRHSGIRPWVDATLWSGGFPCQDLSVAGKRRGMGSHADRSDTRSGLAYAFLDLVERHRPPAILLENVPGLLSSNAGRDFGALLGRLVELGYWWAYRVLDASQFGVPQRRRRVFIVAIHTRTGLGADSPAEVLSVGTRCDGHSAAGDQERQGASGSLADGATRTGSLTAALGHHGYQLGQDVNTGYIQVSPAPVHPPLNRGGWLGRDGKNESIAATVAAKWSHSGGPAGDEHYNLALSAPALTTRQERNNVPGDQQYVLSPSPDSGGVREADGLARRVDDRQQVAYSITPEGGQGADLKAIPTDTAPSLTANSGERQTDRGVRIVDHHPALRAGGHGNPGIGRDGDEARLVHAPTLRVGPAKITDGGPGDTVPIVTAFTQNQREEVRELGDHAGALPAEDGTHQRTMVFTKRGRAQSVDDDESWGEGEVMPTLNSFDVGDTRTTAAVVSPTLPGDRRLMSDGHADNVQVTDAAPEEDDPLLPDGLDSHRYRCCGNGVVAPVSEWIGHRLARVLLGSPR